MRKRSYKVLIILFEPKIPNAANKRYNSRGRNMYFCLLLLVPARVMVHKFWCFFKSFDLLGLANKYTGGCKSELAWTQLDQRALGLLTSS